MIKLVDLLNEIDIPKNEWKPISKGELKGIEKQILDLINNAYGSIGGHPNYKSGGDVVGSEYQVFDLDRSTIESMGFAGRKNVIDKFNVEKMCFSTYSEYKKLIN